MLVFQEDSMSNLAKLKSTQVTKQIRGTVLLLECLHTSALHRQHSSLSDPAFNDPTHTHTHTPVGSKRFPPLLLQPCLRRDCGGAGRRRSTNPMQVMRTETDKTRQHLQVVQSVHTAEFSRLDLTICLVDNELHSHFLPSQLRLSVVLEAERVNASCCGLKINIFSFYTSLSGAIDWMESVRTIYFHLPPPLLSTSIIIHPLFLCCRHSSLGMFSGSFRAFRSESRWLQTGSCVASFRMVTKYTRSLSFSFFLELLVHFLILATLFPWKGLQDWAFKKSLTGKIAGSMSATITPLLLLWSPGAPSANTACTLAAHGRF